MPGASTSLRLSRLLKYALTKSESDAPDEALASANLCLARQVLGDIPGVVGLGHMLPFDAPLEPLGARAGIDTLAAGAEISNWTHNLGFRELLRAKMGALRYASYVPVKANHVRIVRMTVGGSAEWVAENPGVDSSLSTPQNVAVPIALKMLTTSVSYSRQSIFSAASGDTNLEQVLRDDMSRLLGAALELAAIKGLGASNQPLGILQNTSVGAYAMGTNGSVFGPVSAAAMEYTLATANADGRALAWHTTPAVRRKGRTTEGFAGDGAFWRDANTMIGYPAFVSTNVPENLTKGTSTTVCSAAIFGAWEDLVIPTWLPGVEFLVDPYANKRQGMVEITARMYCDVVVANPASFVVSKDLLTV